VGVVVARDDRRGPGLDSLDDDTGNVFPRLHDASRGDGSALAAKLDPVRRPRDALVRRGDTVGLERDGLPGRDRGRRRIDAQAVAARGGEDEKKGHALPHDR
jgi:hypothetical protein